MNPHVDPARLAASTGAARLELVRHVAGCAECRAAVADHDPALLFALLAVAPIPERILVEVSAGVSRRAGVPVASRSRRLAAAAAVVGLALLSGWATLVRRAEMEHRAAVPAPPVLEGTLAAKRADVDVEPGGGVSQVVDMTVGDTQVVMVYNGDLHL